MNSESRLFKLLLTLPEAKDALVYHYTRTEAKPLFEDYKLEPSVENVLRKNGIFRLYKHQVEALKFLEQGKNIIVSTATASGKTLIYLLQIIKEFLKDRALTSIYITPLKALAQDQVRQLNTLISPLGISIAIYDGDTSEQQRKLIKARHPNILLTNPDMLHRALLPYHFAWQDFFNSLRYVILDEIHTYKGIFGSHVHQILMRLKRICRHYGSNPQFILLSATVGNPKEFGEKLLDENVEEISYSTSPKASQDFVFFNPKEGANLFAAKLFCHLIRNKIRTIAFTQSRLATELLFLWSEGMLGPLKQKVRPYRAGFLPSQRRRIESDLASGKLLGVISTSALELGIDIGLLEACILVGYPGTMMTTWQRSGRVGRGAQESVTVLIAKEDALDQYFMKNPSEFFERKVEDAVLDRYNPYIVKDHLACAASELPLSHEDERYWKRGYWKCIGELEAKGLLLKDVNKGLWLCSRKNPQRYVDIRSSGESFNIFDIRTGEAIGSIDGVRAFRECHEGAIYLHMGKRYQIQKLDLETRDILASEARLNYFTRVRSEKQTEILQVLNRREFTKFCVGIGQLKVTEFITGYEKRSFPQQVLLGVTPLTLPPIVFDTIGIWVQINPGIRASVEKKGYHFMGGIHAIEHAAIGMFPLFVLCDRNDIGGISYTYHPNLDSPGIFFYDGYPGGVGLSEKAFVIIEELLDKTLGQIKGCSCESGCPSCIHSPKCGSGNRPLDKDCAILVLQMLLDKVEIEAVSPMPKEKLLQKRPSKILIFDLETQLSSEEVGGWQNSHLMKMSVGCVYDLSEHKFRFFREEDVEELIDELCNAELVVGFNIIDFDYKVLSYYSKGLLWKVPTLDLLRSISDCIGKKVSLNSVARATLRKEKTSNGLQAIKWYKQRNFEKLFEYCRIDVELTRDIYLYGVEKGHVKYLDSKTGSEQIVPVKW